MNNKELQQKIELNKGKYFLIGFILGIIPFLFLILGLALIKGGIEYIPNIFKNTIIILGLITSIANAFIFKIMISNKLKYITTQ